MGIAVLAEHSSAGIAMWLLPQGWVAGQRTTPGWKAWGVGRRVGCTLPHVADFRGCGCPLPHVAKSENVSAVGTGRHGPQGSSGVAPIA